MNKVSSDIYYIGVNDHQIDLFEGQYSVPNGMSYNSYVIVDEKIAVMDTVDINFSDEWLANLKEVLKNQLPDYIVIQHMEPDHSASLINFLNTYPDTTVVGNAKTFTMIKQFFQTDINNKCIVKENDELNLGTHALKFVFAPMVHWPEVMVTYDSKDQILFSADGFGKFGALDIEEDWTNEARRYYIGIVGKYGVQVQNLLKKASTLNIKMICPLHGPVLNNNLEYYLNLYNTWSSYNAEEEGILIVYNSVYGNTKQAVFELEMELKNNQYQNIQIRDLARSDMAEVVALAFKYSKLVIATITYNGDLFPYTNTFIEALKERNYQKRRIGIIENGTWAIMVSKKIKEKFANSKEINFIENSIKINSSLSKDNKEEIKQFAQALINE